MRRFLLMTALMAMGTPACADSPTKTGQSLEDREQAACYDDAQRLCPDEFPDVDKVKSCMADKKKQVSVACAAFYPKNAK